MQQFCGPVQYVSGGDLVVRQVAPSCLTPEELDMVMAARAARRRGNAQAGRWRDGGEVPELWRRAEEAAAAQDEMPAAVRIASRVRP